MKRPKEPIERKAHRHACKHCTEYSQCLAASGFIPGIGFIEVGCSPNSGCNRMKDFDKKHGYECNFEEDD